MKKKDNVVDMKGRKMAGSAKPRSRRSFTREDYIAMAGVEGDEAYIALLTDEEIEFCCEMVMTGMNREVSYRRAFKAREGEKGVSSQTVARRVYRLLQKPEICRFLRKVVEKSISQSADNLDAQLLNSYMMRAFYDIRDYYDEYGRVIPLDDISPEKRIVIEGIETKYYGKDADMSVTTYKMPNRAEALKALGEFANIIRPDRAHNVNITDDGGDDEDEETLAHRYEAMSDEELDEELRRLGRL